MIDPSTCPDISPEALASISQPTFLLTPEGRVSALNPSALALSGRSEREAVLGLALGELIRVRGDLQGGRLGTLLEQARFELGREGEVAPICELVELLTDHRPYACELCIYPVARPGELPRSLVVLVREPGVDRKGFSLATTRWQTDALRTIARALNGPRDPLRFAAAVREVFGADRAWIIHPCAPRAAVCQLLVEHTDPEFPGSIARHIPVRVEEHVQRVLNHALVQKGPLVFERMKGVLADEVVRQFGIKSQMMVRVRPRTGHPWLLGIHQCEARRNWSPEEQNLLASIGLHLTQAIDSRLIQHSLVRPSLAN